MQRKSFILKGRAQFRVVEASSKRNAVLFVTYNYGRLEVSERDEVIGGVGNPVERVARSQDSEHFVLLYERLNLINRFRVMDVDRAVLIVAGPVFQARDHRC